MTSLPSFSSPSTCGAIPACKKSDPTRSFSSSRRCRRYPPPRGFRPTSGHFSSAGRSRRKSNYSIVDANGKTIKLTRVSESTLRKRYRTGLNTFWKFLIDNGYALRTQSSEWAQPVYLSIARADYLYSVAYLRTQYDAGLKLATERGWLRDARIRDLRQLHAGRRDSFCQPGTNQRSDFFSGVRAAWKRAHASLLFGLARRGRPSS